jgi:hypothetical protein
MGYTSATAGYFYGTFAFEISLYGIYFYGIYAYGIYFHTALKFLNIDCTVKEIHENASKHEGKK